MDTCKSYNCYDSVYEDGYCLTCYRADSERIECQTFAQQMSSFGETVDSRLKRLEADVKRLEADVKRLKRELWLK